MQRPYTDSSGTFAKPSAKRKAGRKAASTRTIADMLRRKSTIDSELSSYTSFVDGPKAERVWHQGPLEWWPTRRDMPILQEVAKAFLSFQATSASSEKTFSQVGVLTCPDGEHGSLDGDDGWLDPETVVARTFVHANKAHALVDELAAAGVIERIPFT